MKYIRLISAITDHGHHREYIDVARIILPNSLAPEKNYLRSILLSFPCRQPLFFLSIETHPISFIFSALIGYIFGKPVIGLLFRPMAALSYDRCKDRMKGLFMRFLRRLPNTHIFTILPFSLEPRFQEIASGWIYDFQLWDLALHDRTDDTQAILLKETLLGAAKGRRIIIALGAQNNRKGFGYLVRLWSESAAMRENFLVIAAGKVEFECLASAASFEAAGGTLIDRRLENNELMELYRCADMIWSCYSPDSPPASGIYGRAFQLGIPAIVRERSFPDKLANDLDHQTLPIPFNDIEVAASKIIGWIPRRANSESITLRIQSMMNWTRQVLSDASDGRLRRGHASKNDTIS